MSIFRRHIYICDPAIHKWQLTATINIAYTPLPKQIDKPTKNTIAPESETSHTDL